MGIQAQDILSQDPEFLRRQMVMREMQALNPQGTAAGAIGALLGRGLGNVASGQGFFSANDPALQRAAKVRSIQTQIAQSGETDPTKLATLFADELAKDPELAPFSLQVRAAIKPVEKKTVTLSPGQQVIDPTTGKVLFSAPDKAKPVTLSRGQQLVNPETGEVIVEGAPEEQGKVLTSAEARAQGLPEGGVYQQRPDGTISTIQAPRAPKEFTSSDVSAFTGRVESVTKPIKNTLTDLTAARSFATQAKAGNAKANAQLDRFLAKASGDSQLSQVEVVTVANAGSFPERVVNAVNKFFTGTPTEMSIQEKEDVLNVIEIVYNRRYTDERQSLTTSFAGFVPERVLNANLPAISLSKPAQEYMQRGVQQAAGQAAATPLSPNAARYLTPQPPRASEVPPMSSTLVPPIR